MTAMLQRAFAHDLLQLSNDAVAVIFDDIVVAAKTPRKSQERERSSIEHRGGSQCPNDTQRVSWNPQFTKKAARRAALRSP